MAQISKETRDRDRAELLKVLLGEPNDIPPGTWAMERAEIAKELVAKNPALLLPKNEDRLHNEVNTIFDRRPWGKSRFNLEKAAAGVLLLTYQDDLPDAKRRTARLTVFPAVA
jgi:hypothetical protein